MSLLPIYFAVLITVFDLSVAVPVIEPRIVGGHPAEPHQFPFIVSIAIAETKENNCGGTILSDRWILTAGHCIYGHELNEFVIRAGKHNLTAVENGEQIRNPIKFIVHGDFSPYSIGPNDIGLILLDKPLIFSNTVKPISGLPIRQAIPSGVGIVSGWGSVSDTLDDDFSHILRTITVPILSQEVCTNALKEIDYTEKHFCVGPLAGKIGHCNGDSGGPFVQQNENGDFTIIGIVTFAYRPCGTPNMPPAYTSVSHFVGWIAKKTAETKILY